MKISKDLACEPPADNAVGEFVQPTGGRKAKIKQENREIRMNSCVVHHLGDEEIGRASCRERV